jgi:DNA-directed RNA polymerase subunit H (RpoH/RPB5)
VANDVKQLESLYNNTLKKVIERLKAKEQSLPRPSDQDAVIELERERVKRITAIYKREPKDKSVDEYREVDWLVEDEVHEEAIASQNKQQEAEQNVEAASKKQSSKAPTLTTRRTKQRRQLSPQQNDPDIDVDDTPQPPDKLLLTHKSTRAGPSTSVSSANDQQSVRETRRTSAKEAAKKISELEESRKRRKNGSSYDETISEEEEEEEEEETAKRSGKKRRSKDSRSKQLQQEYSSAESEESEEESMSDPEPARNAAGRRKTRRWTEKEVAQLMALVPQFQDSDLEVGLKKRTTKWAELKAYDRRHGHILRHRSQVMLKDKYREQTDKGQHRQRVYELGRARAAEREKAAKEAALKAIADLETVTNK